ncbi:hypothetical protein F4811DRAFT_557816 [Daldinia bambusicola]|nr:hypothetical protein F4811DRAFT_557816 [Daldinia bambusicola]
MAKGLTLARAFYASGHRVIGADIEDPHIPCPGRYSRSLSAFYRLPKSTGKSGPEEYIRQLVNIVDIENVKLWVSCSGVTNAVQDAQAKEAIEQRTLCKCIQFDVQTTSTLHEKGSFIEACKNLGLSIPETYQVKSTYDTSRILSSCIASNPDRRYILKPVGMDDIHRGDMTILPLASEEETRHHICQLPISDSNPWILQQYIPGGKEYCTHALVIGGRVKCFLACPSSEFLMNYELLQDSALWRAMLVFTVEFVQRSPRAEEMTGHLSFDFMTSEESINDTGLRKEIYAIECNPRAHTAAVLFGHGGPEAQDMVEAYVDAIKVKQKKISTGDISNELSPVSTEGHIITPPSNAQPRYWIGHDLISLLLYPMLLPDLVTFSELRDLANSAAFELSSVLNLCLEDKPPTIGLLCSSSLNFVLTWLGLMRLGYTALILAPELDASAIQHLCANSNTRAILVDHTQAEKATKLTNSINAIKIPDFSASCIPDGGNHGKDLSRRRESDIAYFRHTSGTSSGVPKLIVQGQWGTVGCLPSFSHTNQPATFTTTPLYHGGLADCFRAWTSGAMIWFFPEGVVPITGANVVRSVLYARSRSPTPVKYFSSVPYVLQLLVDEYKGIDVLQSMDLVGVGGAALAPSIGDKLVKLGVNLLSRLGSTECGFLMSSHRNYAHDKEWQYLRLDEDPSFLSFEPRDNGLSELVVKARWPLREKTNRDDCSYATADLFEPHSSIPNAWRYHSRADAQITLSNGKKFDPSPLEDRIKASSRLVQDVLIFGANKEYAGVLLFKTSNEQSDDDIISAVWSHVKRMNEETPSHCRLSKSMLIPVGVEKGEEPLSKSSKGTTLRRDAEKRYCDIIADAYSCNGTTAIRTQSISDADVLPVLLKLFGQVSGREIHPHDDIFQQGVDSIMCIQIRKLIESNILANDSIKLPESFIYDSGTVRAMAEVLVRIRNGGKIGNSHEDIDEWELMQEFADIYSQFETHEVTLNRDKGEVVVLTGATGLLGTHILSQLCHQDRISKIYCLVRGEGGSACRELLSKALAKRKLPGLDDLEGLRSKVICLPCQLSELHLGLFGEDWMSIIAESSIYIHAAWSVNFNLPLNSEEFRRHLNGTRNLLNAALSGKARFFFISSTAAVSSNPSAFIMEEVSLDPSNASPLGYSRSKWVAEQICSKAHEQLCNSITSEDMVDSDISIIRVGQLCGNEAGVWNTAEAYPLLLSTAGLVGFLPELPNEIINWLPVDQAASILSDIILADPISKSSRHSKTPVYHVLNYHGSPSWNQLLDWISGVPGYPSFKVVHPEEWIERLELEFEKNQANHPAQALVGFWRQRYSSMVDRSRASSRPSFDVTSSKAFSQNMRDLESLTQDRVLKMWEWIGRI